MALSFSNFSNRARTELEDSNARRSRNSGVIEVSLHYLLCNTCMNFLKCNAQCVKLTENNRENDSFNSDLSAPI